MRPESFDHIAESIAKRRISRRTALGMTASAGAAIGLSTLESNATAQERATPEASPPAVVTPVSEDVEFMFVQSASTGTFVPNPSAGTPTADDSDEPGGGADYLLTLDGHNGQTVYFSDRPERITGLTSTDEFVEGFGFSPENPPNAALVTSGEDGETIVLVELISPVFDSDADTITYGVDVLSDYNASGLQHLVDQGISDEIPESFDEVSLFIDDCPDTNYFCFKTCVYTPEIIDNVGSCFHWIPPGCYPCNPQLCNEMYPEECDGGCQMMTAEQVAEFCFPN